MSSTELTLTAVWTGSNPPPSTLKLTDYKLPIVGDLPDGYFNALYGNRAAYSALGELLTDAQNKGLFLSTAELTVALNKERKPGVFHMQDISENGGGMVNLTRVSKEVVAGIAAIYKQYLTRSDGGCDLPKKSDNSIDWRKPFRFMPNRLALIPQVFELLQCEVLVHPVRFSISRSDTIHHIASFRLDEVNVIRITPDRHSVGPHPDEIQI